MKKQPTMDQRTHPAQWLVAHRGWPMRFPENSLEGMRAALEAGARFVEFDVQLTADGHVMAAHDEKLERVSGSPGMITAMQREDLHDVHLKWPETGAGHAGVVNLPELRQMLALVEAFPGVTAFVELKTESARRFGRARVVDAVMAEIRETSATCVVISFDRRMVRMARQRGAKSIGWVIRPWNVWTRWQAHRLRPDWLFVNYRRVPARENPWWPGPWRWAVYTINALDTGEAVHDRGADLVETDDYPGLVAEAGGHTEND